MTLEFWNNLKITIMNLKSTTWLMTWMKILNWWMMHLCWGWLEDSGSWRLRMLPQWTRCWHRLRTNWTARRSTPKLHSLVELIQRFAFINALSIPLSRHPDATMPCHPDCMSSDANFMYRDLDTMFWSSGSIVWDPDFKSWYPDFKSWYPDSMF